MIQHIQYFHKGTVYRIRNRKTRKCLCLSSKLQLKTAPLEQSSDQLWIVNQIKNNQYEIVQLKTGIVLTQQQNKRNFDTKLAKRKMTDNQLWNIIQCQKVEDVDFFWVKPCDQEEIWFCASSMDENVRVSLIDPTLYICLWQFVPESAGNPLLSKLSLFRSGNTNLIMEVPGYASNEGVSIIQYLYTGGGNQRWLIQPYEQKSDHLEYSIRNYSSSLCLTAVFTKGAFKVTQSIFTCSPDQRWKIIHIKQKDFLIQSVSNSEYYLGCNNERGGSPVNLLQDQSKSQWVIEGFVPET